MTSARAVMSRPPEKGKKVQMLDKTKFGEDKLLRKSPTTLT